MATATNDMPRRWKARYCAEHRAEPLALPERFGVAAAGSELGLMRYGRGVLPTCGRYKAGSAFNAVVESFFHSLKVESTHGVPLMHPDATRQALFETIEVEYNRTRRYSALGYISPDAFEARIVA